MKGYKTIEVSTECYNELRRLKNAIEEIFGSPVSFTKLIRFLIVAKIDWSDFLALNNVEESSEGK